MDRRVAAAVLAAAAALLLWNLGKPALWEDEAETALRAESILATGLPRTTYDGMRVTTQYSLFKYEGNKDGVWIWNTWLPAYLTAAAFAIRGAFTPFAARLPFALAGLLALWLWLLVCERAEEDELTEKRPHAPAAALVLLALSPAYLLFARQSRYYALAALGTALVLWSWRRLLAGEKWGALALALSLQFVLHSWFAAFAIVCAALAADAALRLDECPRAGRFWGAAALTAALSAPALWYFRVWDRPGNHLYPPAEAFEFLKTFLLWISLFALPALLPAAAALKRRKPVLPLLGFLVLCGLASEGPLSRAAGAAALTWIAAKCFDEPAPYGVMSLRRMCWLLIAATLGLLSMSAAEPYGRYLAGILPPLAYLGGRWISELAAGRGAPALALAVFFAATNWAGWAPLAAATALAGPDEPVQSVSGMMRQRLRDAAPRSDLLRFARETWRGADGYINPMVAAIVAGGGGTVFSESDELCFIFAARLKAVYPDELHVIEPDWLHVTPWLAHDLKASAQVARLLATGRYERVPVEGALKLWENNPDPLYRNFAPKRGPLELYRRRP